jgi:hypothetical protein
MKAAPLLFLAWTTMLVPQLPAQDIYLTTGLQYQSCGFAKEELNASIESYNAVLPPMLGQTPDVFWEKPMKPYTGTMPLRGRLFSYQLRYMSEKSGGLSATFGIRVGKASALERNSWSQYAAGDRWNLWVKDVAVTMEVGMTLGKKVFWNILSTETVFRNTHLTSRSVWADGSTSMGYDHWLYLEYQGINGHYQAPMIGLDLGTSAGLRLGRFMVPMRIGYMFPVFDESQAMVDYSLDSRYRQNSLPKDFAEYNLDTMGAGADLNAIGQNTFRGLRFSFGLEYSLYRSYKN